MKNNILNNTRIHVAAVLLLSFFIYLSIQHINSNSVTVDEFTHIPTGYSYLTTPYYSMDYRGNPPLFRKWLALPLLSSKPKSQFTEKYEDQLGMKAQWHFMLANAHEFHNLVKSCRNQILILGIILGISVYLISLKMYGARGALLSAALYCFSANIIAHTSLATLDISQALTILISQAFFYLLYTRPGFLTCLLCGLFTGLAVLSKFTGASVIIFHFATFASLILFNKFNKSAADNSTPISNIKISLLYSLSLLVALLVLNAGYNFDGSMKLLSNIPVTSGLLQEVAAKISWVRLPLPEFYILGIDSHLAGSGGVHKYFLSGNYSYTGWWNYFLIAYFSKESLPAIIIFMISLASFRIKKISLQELFLLIPSIGTFLIYSTVLKVDLGFRYMLPALPFFYILGGRLLTVDLVNRHKHLVYTALTVLVLWNCAGTVKAAPFCLGYFNELAGGAGNGEDILLESNIDWGQGMIDLKKYTDAHNVEKVHIYNYGIVPGEIYGIKSEWIPCEKVSGTIAISINYLNGIDPFQARTAECFSWLKEYTPEAKLGGGGLWVYKID